MRLLGTFMGGGGTELMSGLRMAYALPATSPSTSRTVVVVTDGFVPVESEAFRFVREHLDAGNLFAFGIGSGVNRALIEGLARAGFGEPFVVLDPTQAAREAERFRAYIERPLLTHIGVSFEGFTATEVAPPKLPDLMAERPLILPTAAGVWLGTDRGTALLRGSIRSSAAPAIIARTVIGTSPAPVMKK
jgi:Ca-activated chloride channel family protein